MAEIDEPNDESIASIKDHPEFQAAVAEAVAKSIPQIIAQLQLDRGQPSTAADDGWMKQLAMQIAELSDQGSKRKKVAPEVMEFRRVARIRMEDLIAEYAAEGRIPKYSLRNKVYLDEMLVQPIWIGADHIQRPTEIDWPGTPNEAMLPVNEEANAIFAAFIDSIGSIVKAVPDLPTRVTPGGLVVNGQAVERKQVGDGRGANGLRVNGRTTPSNVNLTNVLGTVAAPAQSVM